jgi:HAD superfamily hydrolase (TIGR01509 family)
MIFKDIECMLIDMDGVILDNTYDNNFWQNQIPAVIAKNKGISFEDAKRLAIQIFNFKKNTKDWYDIDYWSNMLNVDIEAEKRSSLSFDRIKLYEGVTETLNKLKNRYRLLLITNAHRKTLNIKLEKYDLAPYFENMLCAHELHYVKENVQLWYMLRSKFQLNYTKTVLIEDTINNINIGLSAGISRAIYLGDENYQPSEKIIKLSSINDIFSALN